MYFVKCFLSLVCFFIYLFFLSLLSTLNSIGPFVSTQYQTSLTCHLDVWSLNIGFTLAFVPLLFKSYKFYVIYQNKSLSKINVSESQMAAVVLLAVLVDVAMVLGWVELAVPLHLSVKENDPLRPMLNTFTCNVDHNFVVVQVL